MDINTKTHLISALAFSLVSLFSQPLLALEVGDKAPDFQLEGTDGNIYTLSNFHNKQAVVLAWFPRAYTRGCTIECKSLTEKGHLIRRFDVSYFMLSVDPIEDNKGFAAKEGANFPMLSDPTKETAAAYDVLHEKGYAVRHTFYIGKTGNVLAIDKNINPPSSAEDIAKTLSDLGISES